MKRKIFFKNKLFSKLNKKKAASIKMRFFNNIKIKSFYLGSKINSILSIASFKWNLVSVLLLLEAAFTSLCKRFNSPSWKNFYIRLIDVNSTFFIIAAIGTFLIFSLI